MHFFYVQKVNWSAKQSVTLDAAREVIYYSKNDKNCKIDNKVDGATVTTL